MRVHVFGGGTVSHVRPHLALSAPAHGGTARRIVKILRELMEPGDTIGLHLTRMACPDSFLETNEDVERAVDDILADPTPCVIFFNVAMCDWEAEVFDYGEFPKALPSGLDQPRLKTSEGPVRVWLHPASKVINKIRKERKDIFLVGFKTVTANGNERVMFKAGLNLLKKASCNLVLVNDISKVEGDPPGRNMIVTPEVAPYGLNPFDRQSMLRELVDMTIARSGLTFNRTQVITDDDRPPWDDTVNLKPWREAPDTLQKVVDYCVEQGAYKPFNGVTVGHFGYREEIDTWGSTDGRVRGVVFWSSRRKRNFNIEEDLDLVKVLAFEDVRAFGAKPSAGARSQAQVFKDHPDYDCVVHFHCHARDPLDRFDELCPDFDSIPHRPQRHLECGSLECGVNTSEGMREFPEYGVKAVMLEKHGPNILFKSDGDPDKVIKFIQRNFLFDYNTSQYL